jgi:hypothetical protein
LGLTPRQGAIYALLYCVLGAKLTFQRWTRRKIAIALRLAGRIARPALEALRSAVKLIPGEPHRVLRPIYVPILSIVFRRKKS